MKKKVIDIDSIHADYFVIVLRTGLKARKMIDANERRSCVDGTYAFLEVSRSLAVLVSIPLRLNSSVEATMLRR